MAGVSFVVKDPWETLNARAQALLLCASCVTSLTEQHAEITASRSGHWAFLRGTQQRHGTTAVYTLRAVSRARRLIAAFAGADRRGRVECQARRRSRHRVPAACGCTCPVPHTPHPTPAAVHVRSRLWASSARRLRLYMSGEHLPGTTSYARWTPLCQGPHHRAVMAGCMRSLARRRTAWHGLGGRVRSQRPCCGRAQRGNMGSAQDLGRRRCPAGPGAG